MRGATPERGSRLRSDVSLLRSQWGGEWRMRQGSRRSCRACQTRRTTIVSSSFAVAVRTSFTDHLTSFAEPQVANQPSTSSPSTILPASASLRPASIASR